MLLLILVNLVSTHGQNHFAMLHLLLLRLIHVGHGPAKLLTPRRNHHASRTDSTPDTRSHASLASGLQGAHLGNLALVLHVLVKGAVVGSLRHHCLSIKKPFRKGMIFTLNSFGLLLADT